MKNTRSPADELSTAILELVLPLGAPFDEKLMLLEWQANALLRLVWSELGQHQAVGEAFRALENLFRELALREARYFDQRYGVHASRARAKRSALSAQTRQIVWETAQRLWAGKANASCRGNPHATAPLILAVVNSELENRGLSQVAQKTVYEHLRRALQSNVEADVPLRG
jgi:hypothetical protein